MLFIYLVLPQKAPESDAAIMVISVNRFVFSNFRKMIENDFEWRHAIGFSFDVDENLIWKTLAYRGSVKGSRVVTQ